MGLPLRSRGLRIAAAVVLLSTAACGSRDDVVNGRDGGAPPAPASRPPETTSTTAAASASTDPRVVVLGDSLTAGLGLSMDQAYPALLQQRLTEAGLTYQVVNAGISGDTSAGGLARVDFALEGNVQILIVALGGNDALRGLPPEQLKDNLRQIIERAQARGVSVILAGMEAPPNFGQEYQKAFHTVYPSLAKQFVVPLVPFLLANVAGIGSLNQNDGIHPTAEGDRIVAETVWRVLEPVARKRAVRGEGSSGS